jgi:hypothetical protein
VDRTSRKIPRKPLQLVLPVGSSPLSQKNGNAGKRLHNAHDAIEDVIMPPAAGDAGATIAHCKQRLQPVCGSRREKGRASPVREKPSPFMMHADFAAAGSCGVLGSSRFAI